VSRTTIGRSRIALRAPLCHPFTVCIATKAVANSANVRPMATTMLGQDRSGR
jgi:hypothetical protein